MPTVTEKAASEVKRVIEEQNSTDKLYLRLRVVGGGCSGFQNKLDLDNEYNETKDDLFDQHGIQLIVDKRSLMYVEEAVVDFVSDLNKRGFSITNAAAKGTCGCGSSFNM